MVRYYTAPLANLLIFVFLLLMPSISMAAEGVSVPVVKYEGLNQLDDGRWALSFLLTNTLDRDLTSVDYRVTYKLNGKTREIGGDKGKSVKFSKTLVKGKKSRIKIALGTEHPGKISDVAFHYLGSKGKKTEMMSSSGKDYLSASYNKLVKLSDGRLTLHFIIKNTTKDRELISATYRINYKADGKSYVIGKGSGKTTKFSKSIAPGKTHRLKFTIIDPKHSDSITDVRFETLGNTSKKVTAAKSETKDASTKKNPEYSPQLGQKIAESVQKYEGVRYVWGGTTPKGFDCSGLVFYVCRELGITVPRTSKEQSKAGKYVSKKDLRPGDLVFFGRSSAGPVDHVGVYIGNDTYVHAPNVDLPVMKTRLSDNSFMQNCKKYTFQGKYVTARRVP